MRKSIKTKLHKDELIERRKSLIAFYDAEKQSDDCSQVYLDDLKSSIKNIDKQLQWIKSNPNGVEMINGD